MPQITIKRHDGSKQKFNLANWDQGRAFLKEFIFTGEPGFPDDNRLIRATRQVLREHGFGSGWRHHHLADLRALPVRIIRNLRTPNNATCFQLAMFLEEMIEAAAREFNSQSFWMKHGMHQTLLGRRELEELEAALAELEPCFRWAEGVESGAAHLAIQETLGILRRPNFTKFSRSLPLLDA